VTDPPIPPQDLPYAAAVEELEAILAGLEGDELDVDRLAEQVARAAELIRECRDRIAATRFEVDRIVADLHPQNPAAVRDQEG
jgi:exodeoxyribonuclease VII small subunit